VKADTLEEAVLAEIDRLAGDGPSEAELERVRNLHTASVESSLERIAERADRLSMYNCLFDDPGMINTEVSRYMSVTPGRVRQAMAASLRADNRVVLTYVPLEPDAAAEGAA
jgi:zinc protease